MVALKISRLAQRELLSKDMFVKLMCPDYPVIIVRLLTKGTTTVMVSYTWKSIKDSIRYIKVYYDPEEKPMVETRFVTVVIDLDDAPLEVKYDEVDGMRIQSSAHPVGPPRLPQVRRKRIVEFHRDRSEEYVKKVNPYDPKGFHLVVGGAWRRGKFTKEHAKMLAQLPSVLDQGIKTRNTATEADHVLIEKMHWLRGQW